MNDNKDAILLLDLKIEKYERTLTAVLEHLVDNNPTGTEREIVKEQRILYTIFRNELIDMRNALK